MDSTNDERKKLQHQQMREWCAALQQEKQSAAAAERNADRQYYQMQGEITSSLNEMISAHEDSKQQLLFANAAENQALAEAKKMAAEEELMSTVNQVRLDHCRTQSLRRRSIILLCLVSCLWPARSFILSSLMVPHPTCHR